MKIEDFDKWLEDLIYPEEIEDFVEVLYDGIEGTADGYSIKKVVRFYTDHYRYRIVAIEREDDEGYLGCTTSVRKPRAGEDWTRGNDLPDGPFTKETLEQIKNKIIAYEIVQLAVRKPSVIPLTEE